MLFLKGQLIRLQKVDHLLLTDRKISLLNKLLDGQRILIAEEIAKNPLKVGLMQVGRNPLPPHVGRNGLLELPTLIIVLLIELIFQDLPKYFDVDRLLTIFFNGPD